VLTLDQEQFEIIVAHARKEFPNEACGILAGRDGKVEKVYAMANIDKSPTTYFMEPKEQFRVFKEMRETGLELLGIYHSHASTRAYPSLHDVEMAFYPEALYLIISLEDFDSPDIRAFEIRDGKIKERDIEIGE
jgi:proteasome lid subunit RPN8/RPN11